MSRFSFMVGLVLVVAVLALVFHLFSRIDDTVHVSTPAPVREVLMPVPSTSSTTTSTTLAAKRAVTYAPGSIEAAIVAGFSRFGPDVARQAVEVARCESVGLNPAATGAAGERGLFQMHPVHQEWIDALGFGWDRMYEVEPNIAAAAHLYAEKGWQPWTCRP